MDIEKFHALMDEHDRRGELLKTAADLFEKLTAVNDITASDYIRWHAEAKAFLENVGRSHTLKPCPFCRGVAQLFQDAACFTFVKCIECGNGTPKIINDELTVIKLWNARPETNEQ